MPFEFAEVGFTHVKLSFPFFKEPPHARPDNALVIDMQDALEQIEIQ